MRIQAKGPSHIRGVLPQGLKGAECVQVRAQTARARTMGHLFWADLFCLLISLQRAARKQLSFSPGSACAVKTAFPVLPERLWVWTLLPWLVWPHRHPPPIGGSVGKLRLATRCH